MYGLASNNGIRHAENEKTIVSDLPDAVLVLTTCSAVINYLGVKIAYDSINHEKLKFIQELHYNY